MKLLPLETLRRRAEANAFDIEAIDWGRGVDFTRPFFPVHLTPLSHTAVWGELSEAERLDYNQLYGQSVNEQFIFLEDRFLVRIVRGIEERGGLGLPDDLRAALHGFLEEEIKHTEMFRRLNRLTDPTTYGANDFRFLRLGKAEDAVLELTAQRPDWLVFWVWLALAFEEKTVDYYRHYQRHAKERPDLPLDPLYEQVHHHHMLDEVRHVQIDHHLVRALYERCGRVVRGLNVRLVARTLGAYTRPRRTNLRIVEALCARHPRLAPLLPDMRAQVRGLATCRAWQEITYSRRNAPQTFALFDEFPEMHALARVLLCYTPERVGPAPATA